VKLSPRYDGPAILAIDGDPGDQGVPLARQRRRLESLLAGLGEDEWRAPTRCDGWTVQDVAAHLVGVNAFWEGSVVSGLAGSPTRVLGGFDPAAHPPLMIEPMRAQSPRETFDQLVTSDDGFLGAVADLDDDGWSATSESPAGHVSVRLLAHHALWDAWVHERDIALPLGLTPAVEADEVASSLRYAAAVGPALTISQGRASRGVLGVAASDPDVTFTLEVGDSVLVRDGTPLAGVPCLYGDAVELVEALSVRAPLPDGAPDAWHELIRGLATVFDTVPQT
jgi:uncharacterized protein (TIGR03083 family)